MTLAVPHPNRLLVEGKSEIGAIAELLEKNGVAWGEDESQWPVMIEYRDGIENILTSGVIRAQLKEEYVEVLGVVVDAEHNAASCWQRIQGECAKDFASLPDALPENGLVVEGDCYGMKKRFGVWIMPDNKSPGMLESFLGFLIPSDKELLWKHAQQATTEAKDHGATYPAAQTDKARIYAYLAWQDEPGMLFGTAISKRCLDPSSPHAQPFVEWMRRLFEL